MMKKSPTTATLLEMKQQLDTTNTASDMQNNSSILNFLGPGISNKKKGSKENTKS